MINNMDYFMKRKSVWLLIVCCGFWLVAFAFGSSLSAYAQDEARSEVGKSSASSLPDDGAHRLSLGFSPHSLVQKSSSNIRRVASSDGTVVAFDAEQQSVLYRTDNDSYLGSSYFVSLQKHWLSSVNLVEKRLSAQRAVKNDDSKMILVGDKFVILRREDSFSVFRQDNLQLLWERDFSSDFGSIADSIGIWPERMVIVGQAKDKASFICAAINLADGKICWQSSQSGCFAELAVSSQFIYLAFNSNDNYSSQVYGAEGVICSIELSSGRLYSNRQTVGLRRFYAGQDRLLTISCSSYGAETAYIMEICSPDLQPLNSVGISFLPQWVNFGPEQIGVLYSDLESLERWNLCLLSVTNGEVISHFEVSNKLCQIVCDKNDIWFFISIYNSMAVYLLKDGEMLSVAECAVEMEDSPYLGCSALISGNNLYIWGKGKSTEGLSVVTLDLQSRRNSVWNNKETKSSALIPCGASLAIVTAEKGRFTGETVSRIKLLNLTKGGFAFTSDPIKGQVCAFGGDKALAAANSAPGGESSSDALIYLASSQGELVLLGQNGQLLGHPLKKVFFNWTKWNNLFGVILLTGCILWYIAQANRGKKLFIREIAGLSALDEAVGRATEMGRPVLYIPGVGEIDDTQTMAALSVLGKVSSCTAEYGCSIMVPNCSPVVMSMAQDVVNQSYLKAGCPDSYVSDNICYLSGEQFGFAAGVCGMMVREKPAAVLYMGTFLAEALMLAETGNSTGAIQIAGTASASQLPFFVAACDYTLIGEELYAASAYLSNDPMQIGSLKGQDAAKAAIMILIIAGIICVSCGGHWISYLW
ncbi:MAG: DUF6754 domain-containing protein [Candidatus Bruticola sp.]